MISDIRDYELKSTHRLMHRRNYRAFEPRTNRTKRQMRIKFETRIACMPVEITRSERSTGTHSSKLLSKSTACVLCARSRISIYGRNRSCRALSLSLPFRTHRPPPRREYRMQLVTTRSGSNAKQPQHNGTRSRALPGNRMITF